MRYFGVLKKISFVSSGNILNAVFGLIFLTACARVLSVPDFGRYALLTSLLVFMSKVVDFGSNAVFVAQFLKTQNKQIAITQFYMLKIFLFALATVFSLIALRALNLTDGFVMLMFVAGLVFYAVNVTLFAIYQSCEMFLHAVLLNTIPAGFKAGFGALVLMGFLTPNLQQLYMVFSLSMGLCVVMYIFIPKDFKVSVSPSGVYLAVLPIFKTSAPAGVSQLISQGWPAISNTIVKISKGFSDVGVFYLADKIANVFSLISLSIFTVILPQNARRKKENLPHDLKETAFLGALILVLALGFVGVSGIFVSRLFGDKFSGSLLILDILVISSAISAIHAFMENYFYIHDSTKTIMYISLAKLLVFIVLALSLIPGLSLKGLALSQIMASVVGLFLVIGFTSKKWPPRITNC